MKKACILIVEDERIVALALKHRLEAMSYEVSATVASADDALRAASVRTPDLVLMDIRIQGDRDGIEAAQLLREKFDVPVLFLTAHSDDTTVERAKIAGAAGYLIKPPNERDLMIAIEVALHKHEMMRKLHAREKWYSTTLRSIGDAVVSTDPMGLVSFMNPAAELLTGWRAEDARGEPAAMVVKIVREKGGSDSPLLESLQRREILRVEGTLTGRDGQKRSISDSAAPIVDEAGSLLGAVLVFHDVTEQRAVERRLQSTERLASLGTLAAGIAHEVNNPLSWIVANLMQVQARLAQPDLSPEEREAMRAEVADALAGAERIQRVVEEFSAFTHRAPDASASHVAHALDRALKGTPSTIRTTIEVPPSLQVQLGEGRLVQILSSLLANAFHAIEAAPPGDHGVSVTATVREREALISVADTGIGIEPHVRERIFEPFFTTKPQGQGAGLGLSIVHGLVKAAGGTIDVSNEIGRGTRFTIHLPLAAAAPPEPAPSPVEPGLRGRILLVDDEEHSLRAMARALREHDVVTSDGLGALRRLVAGERFDLVICDLMMPDIEGSELYERILAIDPDQAARFVFTTGGAFTLRASEFLATMKNPVLAKPFTPKKVQELVRAQLASRPRK